MPEVGEARHADEREADGVELGAGEVALVVDVRDLDETVRVAGDERATGLGSAAGERPRVRPAGHLGGGGHGGEDGLESGVVERRRRAGRARAAR